MSVRPQAQTTVAQPSHQAAQRLGRLAPGPWYWILRAFLRTVIAVVLRRHMHVEGADHMPRSGAVLVVSNHISTADPPILGGLSPRPLHFMAKAEWFRHRILGFLGWQFLCYPVVRHSADRAALRHTLDLLAHGQAVAVYPEGTRSEDHRLHRPEAGIGFLARHAKTPIVPVGIWGAEDVLGGRGYRLPRAAETHLVFGEPFTLPDTDLTNQEAAELIMARIAALLPNRYRGYLEET